MTVAIYIAIGILIAVYTLITMATQDWWEPSLKEYWLHYILLLVSVVAVWPVWLIIGFITYVIEIAPRKRC